MEEIVDFARQIKFEVIWDDVQELLDFHHQELTTDEFIEKYEKEHDIGELHPELDLFGIRPSSIRSNDGWEFARRVTNEGRLELGTFRSENEYLSHHDKTIVLAWRLLLVYKDITDTHLYMVPQYTYVGNLNCSRCRHTVCVDICRAANKSTP
ncbi:hypothetical protein TNCV_4818111 [Trichonephila clavipes]|nr:hypothetical protein TNCV_4818111 [Trichonephila clavipes]